MRERIIAVSLTTLTILSLLLITGCHKKPFDPFSTTMWLDEEGRMLRISGYSAGHTKGKQSEFQLIIDNRSGNESWQGEHWILLINQEGMVKEITTEQFNIPASIGLAVSQSHSSE